MNLYCSCGFRLRVSAEWTGRNYHVVFRDGRHGKASPPVTNCPQCGIGLVLEDLRYHPPSIWELPLEPDPDP